MSQASLLVLDDDAQLGRMLQSAFATWGIRAEIFQAARQALDRLQQHTYDVALLDIVMPDMNGMEVLVHIREVCPETKVIMMTGYADKTMAIEALRAGAFDFLEKPIELAVLSHTVNRALEAQTMERVHRQTLEELRRSQEQLQAHANDLEQLNAELRETHQAMLVLARNADRARYETEERMIMHLRSLILPLVEDMRHDDRLQAYEVHLAMLGQAIEDAVTGLATHFATLPSLSTREMRIALMIKNGMTTEDIAMNLHISPETVKTHRRNIRKKLGLIGNGDQLRVYFRSLEAVGRTLHAP